MQRKIFDQMDTRHTWHKLHGLRHCLFGGEKLPPAFVSRIHHELTCRVYNTYGPTEATVTALQHVCNRAPSTSLNNNKI